MHLDARPTQSDKGAFVREMFARIAPRYDLANRVLTGRPRRALAPARDRAARAAARRTRSSTSAAAPATWSFNLLRTDPTLDVTGIDFCAPMLDGARDARARSSARQRARSSKAT